VAYVVTKVDLARSADDADVWLVNADGTPTSSSRGRAGRTTRPGGRRTGRRWRSFRIGRQFDLDLVRARSPLWTLKKTSVKVLMQHGEQDERVPLQEN
jgi:hypothetical protein